jgi:pimeloyl-ACP methyl ester carboxylesterase
MKSLTSASILVMAVTALTVASPGAQFTPWPTPPATATPLIPPDPCISSQFEFEPEPWPSQDLTVMGRPARLFEAGPSSNPGDPPVRHSASLRPLVLVVDGNSFDLSGYNDLAGYLAKKGFNVIVVDRTQNGGPDPVDQARAAIDAAFEELGLPADARVGVIGHSYGGTVAIDTAVANHDDPAGYNIEALVLLAPKVSDGAGTLLSSSQVPALLAVYGSQDHDVGGLAEPLTDAFAAYDRSGTESSTTCHNGFCHYQAQMHRTMVYIHGADHSGLVNRDPEAALGAPDPFNNYVARSDQFCITKAYTLAMLEWALDDNAEFKSMVHGKHVPASINSMTTDSADEQGNAAGTPVRIGLQVSPKKRSVIENFEDSAWTLVNQTPNVLLQLVTEGEYSGDDMNIRHATKLGLIGWPEHDDWQLLGFAVPSGKRNVTGFTHVAMRLGQLAAVTDAAFANPPNSFPSVMIGLFDGVSSSWVWSDEGGQILPADRRPNGQYQSVMSTVKIPLSAFSGLDKGAVEAVLLAFPAGTQGTLLVDSVEWFKE